MANYIRVGLEYINIERACHIQVFSNSDDEVIVEVEYEHSVRQIPCAGTEEEVRTSLNRAIYNACDRFAVGAYHPTEVNND